MKHAIGTIALCLLLTPLAASAADDGTVQTYESTEEKVSYSIGLDLGKYLSTMKDKVDYDILKEGIDDGFTGAEPKLSEAEMAAAQQEFAATVKAEQEAMLEEMKSKNREAGAAFLEENRKKEGVVVTESGLQYEVLEQGDGATPEPSDTVRVDYVGTLIDGTEFDSSIKRGEPVTFPVDQVIPGWTEALQLMEVGSKYRVAIPAELAYGEAGAPPVIEPNSVLVFEIELLDIEAPAAADDQEPPAEAEAESQ